MSRRPCSCPTTTTNLIMCFSSQGSSNSPPGIQDSYRDVSTALKDLQPISSAQTSVPSSRYSTSTTLQAVFQLSRFSKRAGSFQTLCLSWLFLFHQICVPSFSGQQEKLQPVRFITGVIVLVKPCLINQSFHLYSHSTLQTASLVPFIDIMLLYTYIIVNLWLCLPLDCGLCDDGNGVFPIAGCVQVQCWNQRMRQAIVGTQPWVGGLP